MTDEELITLQTCCTLAAGHLDSFEHLALTAFNDSESQVHIKTLCETLRLYLKPYAIKVGRI